MTVRAFADRLRRGFLVLPLVIVLGFVLLAYGVDWLDNHAGPRGAWGPVRLWLGQYVGDTQSAIGMLSAIAGALITVTSITFSILLLAVQQGAAVLNAQVVDHYLARASNRAWLGFFVGVSVFVLVTLVQTTHTKAPVLGVIVSAGMGAASLLALVVLIRSTIDQTRPTVVIETIHHAAIAAHLGQQALLALSAEPDDVRDGGAIVRAASSGRLMALDAPAFAALLDRAPDVTAELLVQVGDHVVARAPVARLHGTAGDELVAAFGRLLAVHTQRDVTLDPSASLDHLAAIGWTALSSAKSDPAVSGEVLNALHDLLARWSGPVTRARQGSTRLLLHDGLPDRLFDALESGLIAAAESHQHQGTARILQMVAATWPAMTAASRARAVRLADLAGRTLDAHQPSALLVAAIARLALALENGEGGAAHRLRVAAEAAWGPPGD